MEDIFVGRVMSADVLTVTPDTLVETAAQTMLGEGVGSVVIVDGDGRLEGILTTTDFVRIVAERDPKDDTPVGEYMSTDVVTTTADASIREAADAMIQHGVHHLPVVDGDHVIGVVSTTDLTAYLSHARTPSPS
ncbi:MAG: cyclic nucleotide-binding/CBS domain-containing protein [Halobacteriaceae archaeon]